MFHALTHWSHAVGQCFVFKVTLGSLSWGPSKRGPDLLTPVHWRPAGRVMAAIRLHVCTHMHAPKDAAGASARAMPASTAYVPVAMAALAGADLAGLRRGGEGRVQVRGG